MGTERCWEDAQRHSTIHLPLVELLGNPVGLSKAIALMHIYQFAPIPYSFLHQRPQKLADNFVAMGISVTYIEPCGFTEFLKGHKKGLLRVVLSSLYFHCLAVASLVLPFLSNSGRRNVAPAPEKAVFESISLPLIVPHNRFNSHFIEKVNAVVYRQVLRRRVFRKMSSAEVSVALVENPFFGCVLRKGDFDNIIYDCLDELRIYAGRASLDRFQGYEVALIHLSDFFVATARQLEEHIRSIRPTASIRRVPNGVDADWFREHSTDPVPDYLRGIPKPIVGYAGMISSWMDYELVSSLATEFPAVSFVFLGPVDFPWRVEAFTSTPNVHWLGRKPYQDIPSCTNAFDVCVIPFLDVEIVRATNPVKIYEYFALGKPVVSTLIDELLVFEREGLVAIGRTATEFAASLRLALQENDPRRQDMRREVANAHSWRRHAETIVSTLRGARA
jgi:glycosyltransferase involved in cell wall biosynthesis